MTTADLAAIYRAYIACLNRQDWPLLAGYVHEDVRYNGEPVGLAGYRAMLEEAAWLRLHAEGNAVRPSCEREQSVVHRKRLLSIPERIEQVWSIIDKAAIERQLAATSA